METLSAGIHAVRSTDPGATELHRVGPAPGLTDVAALADFGLGAALRAELGAGQRLPTITLTLELDAGRIASATAVRAWAEPVRAPLGRAHGVILAGSHRIGQCSATFAVLAQQTDLAPLPWETSVDDPLVNLAAAQSAEAMMADACSVDGDTTQARPTGAMLNRSGFVQGAALFRLAASLPRPSTRLVSGHLQFLRPAVAEGPVRAEPVVVSETRRMVFVQTFLRQQEVTVAAGGFVFGKGDD